MEKIDELEQELVDLMTEVERSISVIGNLTPVTYLSQAKIQFYGGIPGAIRESRERKRLEKMIEAPLYKDKSYIMYWFYLAEIAEKAAEILLQLQQLLSKEDERYFGFVVNSYATIETAQNVLYHYSPDIYRAVGAELSNTTNQFIKEAYCKLDLPETMQSMKQPVIIQQKSSGCFGILLLFATATMGLTASLIIIL